jgi:NADPH:quinone reductase-like Zn-dependent oxidoreductase
MTQHPASSIDRGAPGTIVAQSIVFNGGPMRVYEIQSEFGMDNLRIAERPDPEPGPGEVRLAMRAVSLNYRDLLMVRGHYNPRQPLPLIPCSDGVGEVTAVGDGVRRVAVGDRVATAFSQTWIAGPPTVDKLSGTLGGPIDGTLAEQMVLSAEGVVPVPGHMTDVEAATLPCAALTAWSAMVEQGTVGAGDVVLVQGTGGVSIFALQIAQLLGARVIVTSSSQAKMDRATSLGAWRTLNYRDDPRWGKTVRTMTDGVGVDLVVEVGGAGTLEQSLKAVRVGGQVSVIGVLSGIAAELSIIPLLMQQLRLQGILVGSREGFERMNRAFAAHEVRPVVDRVFGFDDVPAAFELMASGGHFGKICIAINP